MLDTSRFGSQETIVEQTVNSETNENRPEATVVKSKGYSCIIC